MLCQAVFKLQIIAIALLQLAKGYPQTSATEEQNEIRDARPGRYVPALHGGDRGRYVPDLSGKYRHMLIPYDGGYGDRGVKYEQDLRGILQYLPVRLPKGSRSAAEPFGLGPRDHLRFMIDFNYDGSGWQVLQFEWKRDGEESQSYSYQKDKKLEWDTQPDPVESGYIIETPAAAETGDGEEAQSSMVHVDGEYDANIYNVSYKDDNARASADPKDLQNTIKEVLDYVQTHILPTLT